MKWLLIVFLAVGHGRALDMEQFSTRAECEAAAKVVAKELDDMTGWFMTSVQIKCVEVRP